MSRATTISRRRERELAGDNRSWPRNEARRVQHEYLRRNWRYLPVVAGFTLALVPLLWLLPAWLLGPATGALIANAIWMVVLHAVVMTDTARMMVGGEAERWTASELRRLRRRGWRVVHHVLLHRGSELDHVAIGPGGLVAFETKWIGKTREPVDAGAQPAVDQIKRNGQWLSSMFPNDVPREAFSRVVVLWGPVGSTWGPPREVDGTVVVSGRHLRKWLDPQTETKLSDDTVARVFGELEKQMAKRDRDERERQGPIPMSLGDLTARVVLVVAALLVLATGVASVVD